MTVPGRVSVVVVTWNGWPLLERCLASVERAAARGIDAEVIVVDNASTDGTDANLRARHPAARYVCLSENRGFAVANNRALDQASGEWIFLLNNDAVLADGALAALLDASRRHPEFDVFAPEMVRLRAPAVVDNHGIYLDRTGHFRQLDAGAPAGGREPCEVFGASGGACLVRRAVIDRCGLFDGRLESYLEDCDFACRARAGRHRCLFVPSARVLHEGSATGDLIADRKLYLIQRNMVIVQRRWIPFRPLRLASWLGAAYEAYQVVRALPAGRGGVVLRAKRDGVRQPRDQQPVDPAAGREIARWVGVRARPLAGATPVRPVAAPALVGGPQ